MASFLEELEKQSIDRKMPIIGSEKAKWLLSKVREISAKKILELGTANGYSGCVLAQEGAELLTIEKDAKIAKEAEKNFSKFKINATVIIGDGVEEIKKLNSKFDLIFIDFAKKSYIEVLEDSIRLVRKGGLIIADNISFEGCRDFVKAILQDKRLKTYLVPIKDGLSCSERI